MATQRTQDQQKAHLRDINDLYLQRPSSGSHQNRIWVAVEAMDLNENADMKKSKKQSMKSIVYKDLKGV